MGTAGKLALLMLAPSAVFGAFVWLPRLLRVLRVLRRRAGGEPLPTGPPLEKTAADLRRLLAQHEAVRRSPGLAAKSAHLAALDGAITDSAYDAARAVGVDPPPRTGRAPLSRPDLRRLLTQLADSGVVLPSLDRFGR